MARRLAVMIFTQHYLGCLSHASYLIGDETTGRAVVVDPRRDVGDYLAEADELGLTIERVIETHVHADFLSGHLELAARTGAVISYGDAADGRVSDRRSPRRGAALARRASPSRSSRRRVTLPSRSASWSTSTPTTRAPYAVLTGDTLFIGDVGRPDLLATTDPELTSDVLGRQLYHSLHDKLLPKLSDSTRVYPAHGAGSSCGRNLSSETSSTARRAAALELRAPADGRGSSSSPRSPKGNRRVPTTSSSTPAATASSGRCSRRSAAAARRSTTSSTRQRRRRGAARRRVSPPTSRPGTSGRGERRAAGTLRRVGRRRVGAGRATSSSSAIPRSALEAKVRLGRVGYDRVVGQLDDPAAVFASATRRRRDRARGSRSSSSPSCEGSSLSSSSSTCAARRETSAGTLPGAREIPLPCSTELLDGLDPRVPWSSTARAGTARRSPPASLVAAGFADVSDLLGGFGAWDGAGLPIATADGDGDRRGDAAGRRARRASARRHGRAAPRRARARRVGCRARAGVDADADGAGARPSSASSRVIGAIVVVCRSGGRSAAVTESCARGDSTRSTSPAGCARGRPRACRSSSTGRRSTRAGLVVHKRAPAQLRDVDPRPHRRRRDAQHALLRSQPLRDARARSRTTGGSTSVVSSTSRLQLSLRDLQNMVSHTLVATLECAGNGRSAFDPPVVGEQWQLGAVSTAEWTGVPLVEVFDRAAPSAAAREIVLRGADNGSVEGSAEPDLVRAQPLARRRARLGGAARLHDERRAAPTPARLSASASSSPVGTRSRRSSGSPTSR